MTTLERTGSSVESLIAAFRNEYHIKDWELKYKIIKKPSKGFLGLFAQKQAVISFELPSIEERVKLFFQMLLAKMGLSVDKINLKKEGKSIYLDVIGCKDPGFLIGKNGSMLKTLQFYLNRVFEGDRRMDAIYLDVEGYQEKQDAQFLRGYTSQFAKVKSSGNSLTLEPMDGANRRIIHRYIASQKGLRTLTVGEGDKKRIVIFPAQQSEKEVIAQTGLKPTPSRKKAKPQIPNKQKPKPNNPKPDLSKGKARRAPTRHTPKKTGV